MYPVVPKGLSKFDAIDVASNIVVPSFFLDTLYFAVANFNGPNHVAVRRFRATFVPLRQTAPAGQIN